MCHERMNKSWNCSSRGNLGIASLRLRFPSYRPSSQGDHSLSNTVRFSLTGQLAAQAAMDEDPEMPLWITPLGLAGILKAPFVETWLYHGQSPTGYQVWTKGYWYRRAQTNAECYSQSRGLPLGLPWSCYNKTTAMLSVDFGLSFN